MGEWLRKSRSGVGGRMARLLWAGGDDPSLRPVLAVTLLSAVSFSTFWSYVGVWAVKALGATPAQVGVMYLFSASAAGVAGYVGGHLSDRFGRKPLMVFALAVQSVVVLGLTAVDHRLVLGFALVVAAGVVGAPYLAATNAIVADLVPPERRENAYATVRVVNNLGLVLGPPVAGLLLVSGSWTPFLVGVAAVGLTTAAVAASALPAIRPVSEDERPPRGSLRLILRDVPFLLLLASTLLGFVVYVAFETVLPVIAVSSFDLAPSAWGFLVIINPVLVTLFQLRLTVAVAHVRADVKLVAAMMLMGLPFLAFLASGSASTIAAVIFVFVVGEMLWVPTANALAAAMAPAEVRGAYMGAYTSSAAVAWTLAPLIALQLRAGVGDAAVWFFFASVGLASAVAGAVAARSYASGRARPEAAAAT